MDMKQFTKKIIALGLSLGLISQSTASNTIPETPHFKLTSTAFKDGDPIPPQYTCDGDDFAPPLAWSGVPAGTVSFALIMDDPDAPAGSWYHWLIFNIPPTTTTIANKDNLPDGALAGINSWGRASYGSPCPPAGTHRYFFKLYALDTMLTPPTDTHNFDHQGLEVSMRGHILGETRLMGTYAKK